MPAITVLPDGGAMSSIDKVPATRGSTTYHVQPNNFVTLDLSNATGVLPVVNGGSGNSSYTDGQLLIGNSATGLLTKATLIQGAGVTITNGNGTITISAPEVGTVTTVSVATANGFSGTVATPTSTPTITIIAGAITPTSVNGLTLVAQSIGFTIAGGTTSKTLTVPLDASVSGTNTGDQTNITGNAGTVTVADTASATCYVAMYENATGNLTAKTDLGITYNATTANLATTTFTGALVGNASTATTAAAWITARNLAGNSVNGSANVAFANKFIVQGTADTGLSAAQFLGALGTGIVKNTTTTGVLSIASVGSDYVAPGTVTLFTAQQNFATATLTSTSNSIAWNLNIAQVAVHTLTEDTTLANPTNMVDGGTYIITFIQAASAKALAFGNAYKWPSGTAPVVSTGNGAVDVYTFVSNGTLMRGSYQQNIS